MRIYEYDQNFIKNFKPNKFRNTQKVGFTINEIKVIIIMTNGAIILIISVILLKVQALTTSYSQTMSGSSRFQALSFNATSGYNVISIQFIITNDPQSNVLAVASLSPIPTNLTRQAISSYFANQSNQLNFIDLISAISGSPQIINILIPNSSTTMIYVNLFNFDLPENRNDKNYLITFRHLTKGKYCRACPNGTYLTNIIGQFLKCQCEPCPPGFVGSNCQFFVYQLTQKSSVNRDFIGTSNAYFRIIDKGNDISLIIQEITRTNAVRLYVQYEYSFGQLAGKLNSYYNNFGLAFSVLITNLSTTVNIPSMGKNVLLTLQSAGNTVSSVAIVFSYVSTPRQALTKIIFASCLGGIGIIIAVIILFQIYRRFKLNSITITNQNFTSFGDNRLQPRQIDIISPQITYESFCELNKQLYPQRQNAEIQCSICFEELKKSEILRITYCRHLFHSKCLNIWFQTTRKCPDCNQIFDQSLSLELSARKEDQKSPLSQTFAKDFLSNYYSQQKTKSRFETRRIKIEPSVEQKSIEQLKVEDMQQQATQS